MRFENLHPDDRDPDEEIGRIVTNALDQPELVAMERKYWDYLDWLKGIGANIENYIKNCDRSRGIVPFGDALAWWTYYAYEDREKEGLPRPDWLPPLDLSATGED